MKKKLLAVLSILLIAAVCCSCGKSASYDSASYVTSEGYAYDNGMSFKAESAPQNVAPTGEEMYGYDSDAAFSENGSSDFFMPADNRKIVYTTYMHIETKEFQESIDAIMTSLKESGGYVASKNQWGGYTSAYGDYRNSSAELTLKIPAANYQSFLSKGESFGNITSQNDSSDDITSQYIDTESRLRSLELQRDQLMELMEKADKVEDIIVIQSQLSDVIYRIENYTSTINTYDNMVAYCTVTITIDEVSTITVHADSFGEEIVEAFKGSGRAIVEFLRGFVIVLIYALPFLVILFVVFLIVRRSVRRRRAKLMNKLSDGAPDNPGAGSAPVNPTGINK